MICQAKEEHLSVGMSSVLLVVDPRKMMFIMLRMYIYI